MICEYPTKAGHVYQVACGAPSTHRVTDRHYCEAHFDAVMDNRALLFTGYFGYVKDGVFHSNRKGNRD